MKLPPKTRLIALTLALTAAGLLWVIASRSDGPRESVTVGITEDERDELRGRGIVVLPGAKNVNRRVRDLDSPVSEIVHYELEGVLTRGEFNTVVNSIITSLKGVGWNVFTATVANGHGKRIWAVMPDGEHRQTGFGVENRAGTLRVSYLMQYERELRPQDRTEPTWTATRLIIEARSFKARLTPTPPPNRRPIS